MGPLANKTFRNLFILRALSFLGTGLATIALALKAYSLGGAHAGVVLGTALTMKMIAYIIMAPLCAHFLQRHAKKYFLIAMDFSRCLLLVLMLFVTHIWQIYVLIFLISSCAAGATPTYLALTCDLLSEPMLYSKALCLNRIVSNVETIASPALAALLLLTFSYNALFLINAITFFISGLGILLTAIPSAPMKTLADENLKLLHGLHTYLRNHQLLGGLCLLLLAAFAGATVLVNSVVFIHGMAKQSQSMVALAMGCFGLGAITFASFLTRLRTRVHDTNIMLLGALLILVVSLIAAIYHSWIFLLLIWFVFGCGAIAIETPLSLLITQHSQGRKRNALFAANFSLSHAGWLVAYMAVGTMGSTLSLRPYFGWLSVISLSLVLLALWLWRHA